MNPDRLALLLARERLRERIAHQRTQLASAAWPIETACSVADTAGDGARWAREHAHWLIGAAVALLVIRPRGTWRWARRLFAGWRLWRSLRDKLAQAFQA